MSGETNGSLALVLHLLRDEGPRAVRDRVIDRWKESHRLRRLEKLTEQNGRLDIAFDPPPVLNVSPTPPSPKRGGAQIQMLDRLAEEKKLRTVALAYPRGGRWWMEIWAERSSGVVAVGPENKPLASIQQAARLSDCGVVHIESLSGLPLNLVPGLEDRGLTTVLSVHDFTLFCRKPHLIERATGKFCDYCRDMNRCTGCLSDIDPAQQQPQINYRHDGGEALARASAVIFPSDFLRRRYDVLFPGRSNGRMNAVIAPATSRPESLEKRPSKRTNIAFVGGAHVHKGGALIAPTMKRVLKHDPTAVGFVYGSGDRQLTRQLRRTSRIRVRGYYRQGRLPSLLIRDRITLAVFPSIWPEAYGLVVDECLSSGISVIAFDHGAVGHRLDEWGVGRLIPLRREISGLADSIIKCLAGDLEVPNGVRSSVPRPGSPANRHLEVYDSLSLRSRQ